MSGIALSRLLNGGKGKNVDQLGNQLGNAGLGKIGYGQELTPENFNTVMQNQRSMYAKAGIKSKSDAYALTDRMLKEGRINQIDAVTMQQAFNMMYDTNGYDTAKRLMAGRNRGAEVAHQNADVPPPRIRTTDNKPVDVRNIPGREGSTIATINAKAPSRLPEQRQQRAATLSKEEAQRANKERYSSVNQFGYQL